MAPKSSSFKGIKDVFYESRVQMGKGYTLKRFSEEVLGGAVDPAVLNEIEKGRRFPDEGLVRRLAVAQKLDPWDLLVMLWHERMLVFFSRELNRFIEIPRPEDRKGIAEADLAFLVSRAIAALPDDGGWMPSTQWLKEVQKAIQEVGKRQSSVPTQGVVDALNRQKMIELKEGQVRRIRKHYVAESPEERRSLAMEFCGIFSKALLDAVVRQGENTYVQNHYLHIPEDKIKDFHKRLDQMVRGLVEEFAIIESDAGKFVNVLLTSTPL